MWRSLFLALGSYCCLLGGECLLVDKVVLKPKPVTAASKSSSGAVQSRDVVPPDWAPWSLMSGGAVTVLYSFTLPKRGKE